MEASRRSTRVRVAVSLPCQVMRSPPILGIAPDHQLPSEFCRQALGPLVAPACYIGTSVWEGESGLLE